MSIVLPCSYLRVYQPREVFDPALRAQFLVAQWVPQNGTLGLIAAEESRELYMRQQDGVTYFCPAQTKLRTLLGIVALDRALPPAVARDLFAGDQVSRARLELQTMSAAPMLAYLLQTPWHVPIRWFTAFTADERRLEHGPDGLRIRYETAVGDAHRRVGRGLDIVRGTVGDGNLIRQMDEFHDWLGAFHPGGILELDYASVSTLFEEESLAGDDSCMDTWQAIESLARGDTASAAIYYRSVYQRWNRTKNISALN